MSSGTMLAGETSVFRTVTKAPSDVKEVIFTDLDGTLLHPVTYSYISALDTLRLLQERGIPVVFCSAKTYSEQLAYRQELGIVDPFIVENGGAIFVPRDYFRLPFAYDKETDDYLVIELGSAYEEIRLRLDEARQQSGLAITGLAT